jgi:GNAT superfamily N-acetyltransferase
MEFDAALARRMLNNRNLRASQGWAEIRDLGGALALTSDTAPIPGLNCLLEFDTREAALDSLLDIGFGLLRAFDRDPAVEVTPLDRPTSLAQQLKNRRLRLETRGTWMVFRGDAEAITPNPAVEVRIAEPDEARVFAQVLGGGERWVRQLGLRTTLVAVLEPGNTFYLGCVDGVPVSTLHLLIDGATAGVYAVETLKAHRRQGISSTLMRRAIMDARAAGCDAVVLSTATDGYAESLYTRQGFQKLFESQMWVQPSL